jgi:hypothetical protein
MIGQRLVANALAWRGFWGGDVAVVDAGLAWGGFEILVGHANSSACGIDLIFEYANATALVRCLQERFAVFLKAAERRWVG